MVKSGLCDAATNLMPNLKILWAALDNLTNVSVNWNIFFIWDICHETKIKAME